MSFLSDLGGIIGQAQQVSDQINSVRDELVQQAVSTAGQVQDQADSIKSELQNDRDMISTTLQDTSETLGSLGSDQK
jgi:conjugal transfer/entry exclusion protein